MLSPLHFSKFQICHNEYGVCSVGGETHQIQKKRRQGAGLGWEWVECLPPSAPLLLSPVPPYAHPPAQSMPPTDSSHALSRKQTPRCQPCPSSQLMQQETPGWILCSSHLGSEGGARVAR